MRLKNLVFHISTAPPYKHRFFSDFSGAYMEDLLYKKNFFSSDFCILLLMNEIFANVKSRDFQC